MTNEELPLIGVLREFIEFSVRDYTVFQSDVIGTLDEDDNQIPEFVNP